MKPQRQILLHRLREEKVARLKGGLYHATQTAFSYNSNRIEGSRLTEEQTRHIFETNSFIPTTGEAASVDDVIETVNHFICFDRVLDTAEAPLSEKLIKELHATLKSGTSDARRQWFKVGDYKSLPNTVGGVDTTSPEEVPAAMQQLLEDYKTLRSPTFEDIVAFHHAFEAIHPFQDGNGRVGRLIAFKECLKHGITPFIIDEQHKAFYYRGLSQFSHTPGYLLDTCRSAQDQFAAFVKRFAP